MATPPFEEPTQPSLLLRLRDPADEAAWATFVSTYLPLVYGYGRKCGLQDADAADVAQDVMRQVVRSMRGFVYDPERGRFRDWLRTVTRNRLARFHAARPHDPSRAPGPAPPEVLADASLDAEWADDFQARVLEAALEQIRPRFEPETWRAFERTWLEQAGAAEVAEELGLGIDLVYAAKSRVLKRLREQVLMLAEDLPLFVPLDARAARG